MRAYRLNLFGRRRSRTGAPKSAGSYALGARDDRAAVDAAEDLHAWLIARTSLAELLDDQGRQVMRWANGVAAHAPPPPAQESIWTAPLRRYG